MKNGYKRKNHLLPTFYLRCQPTGEVKSLTEINYFQGMILSPVEIQVFFPSSLVSPHFEVNLMDLVLDIEKLTECVHNSHGWLTLRIYYPS